MNKSFGYALPGSIYEVSPDFGMFSQAWNMYAFGVPIINQFLGINPEAYLHKVTFNPILPNALETGSLKNIEIGNNEFEVSFENLVTSLKYTVSQKGDFNLEFKQPVGRFSNWEMNGKPVKPTVEDGFEKISFSGKSNTIQLKK